MTTESRVIPVLCVADAAYALGLAVMLKSLERNLDVGYSVDAYVADAAIPAGDKRRVEASLSARIRVHWRRTAALPQTLPTWGRMPVTTYQKLLVGDWALPEVGRALWLDCDLLILSDLVELWSLPMGGTCALAAPDQRVRLAASRFGVAGHADLGLSPDAKYFNAGVMLIDLQRWRAEEVGRRSLEYLAKYGKRVYFWDQEALNAVLAGVWGELDAGWNWHPSRDRLVGSTPAEPRIVHFSGNLKPWTHLGSGRYHELYYGALDQTAWTGWRPERYWKGRLAGWYETSSLRRVLYPAERWATQIRHSLTQR